MVGNASLSTLITGVVSGLLMGVGAATIWGPSARDRDADVAHESRRKAEELLALDGSELLARKEEVERLQGVEGKAVLALIACSAARARAEAEAQPKAETCSISPALAGSPTQRDTKVGAAAASSAADGPGLIALLRNEGQRTLEAAGPVPSGAGSSTEGVWTRGPIEVSKDANLLFKGRQTTVIRSTAPDERTVSVVMRETSAAPYRGRKLKYAATLVLENVVGHAVLWIRVEDGFRKVLGSKNHFLDEEAARRRIQGYNKYKLTLNVPQNAELVTFGLLMTGGGVIRTGQVLLRPDPEHGDEASYEFDFAQGPG